MHSTWRYGISRKVVVRLSKSDWYYSLKDKTYIKKMKKDEIEDDGDGEIVEV